MPKDVLQWYKVEEGFHIVLKKVSMENHDWSLRSWDHAGAGVVKLYCGECQTLIGGSTGQDTKSFVTNLYYNLFFEPLE